MADYTTNLDNQAVPFERSSGMRRVAIIDMGSNSFRLIVMAYVPGKMFKMIDEVREVVRIGEGMAEVNALRPAAIERGVRAAQIYAGFCEASGISDIITVGTSAIRDARNRALFIDRVRREAGLEVRLLSGETEAYYGYLAAVNSTTLNNGYVFDLGGGSIQITRVENRRRVEMISLPLGAVRLKEGFLHSDPARSKEVSALGEHLRAEFAAIDWFRAEPGMMLVGEGGTLRLIGRLIQKERHYPLDILHGFAMQRTDIGATRDLLADLSVADRKKLPGMKPDRADISLGGATAVYEALSVAGFDAMTICGQGLREGLFYERFLAPDAAAPSDDQPPLFAAVRQASAYNLAQLYHYQEAHAQHIAHLPLSMFDQLPPDERICGPSERELLWAASILHDIGTSIDYHDHHKHGAYLILNAGLPGYTHREIALIALLVRYHRKGKPTADELAPLLAADDDRRLLQMAALLRLAEQLDRSRDGVVSQVVLTFTADHALLEIRSRGDEQVPLWAVENHLDIFSAAFGKPLVVVPVPDEPDEVTLI
ncbi:MAG: Ppx/GppA family phosphatase [Chloroflexi bacterium]|nr:Ppx/GppA family phosphatase [Chloroflexota bacterium]